MKYFVAVGGREVEIDVDGERVTIDGTVVEAHLERVPGTPLRQLTIDGRTHVWPVQRLASGRWLFAPHGDAWKVEVLDERTRHIRQITGTGQGESQASVVTAPMPGLVVRIEVEPGQSVDPGQGVVVLEAMKMENELRAVGGGVVRAVLVAQGSAVEKGDVLVEFEDGSGA